jgi:hypothetical protein
MKAPMAALAALAGGLLLLPAAQGPASATSAPINLKNVIGDTAPGSVELVRQGGGGGGGGGRGGGGGDGGGGHGGGGGGPAFSGGGGGGPAIRGGGGGPRVGAGPRGGGRDFSARGGSRQFAGRPGGRDYSGRRSYAARDLDRSGPRGDRDNRRGRQTFDRDRDHDHGKGDRHRHRVFRNGVWVWVYGPDYYYDDYAYGGDCYWLRQQAYATGSPYWWSRYNACLGYY